MAIYCCNNYFFSNIIPIRIYLSNRNINGFKVRKQIVARKEAIFSVSSLSLFNIFTGGHTGFYVSNNNFPEYNERIII